MMFTTLNNNQYRRERERNDNPVYNHNQSAQLGVWAARISYICIHLSELSDYLWQFSQIATAKLKQMVFTCS